MERTPLTSRRATSDFVQTLIYSGAWRLDLIFVNPKPTPKSALKIHDEWMEKFLTHLATDRGASVYTQRNYQQALAAFHAWHQQDRKASPTWETRQRGDLRSYLRFLGRQGLGRAAVALRFSALRTFYKHLTRHGRFVSSPIKNVSLP